jgi:hypothetical protein
LNLFPAFGELLGKERDKTKPFPKAVTFSHLIGVERNHSKYLFLIQRKFIMKTSHFSINGTVDARSHKRLLNKGKLLAAALPVCLALASQQALAIDAARGVAVGSPITIDSFSFLQLASLTFSEGPTSRSCIAVASAQLNNPVGVNLGIRNRYEFGLFRFANGSEVGAAHTREVELNDSIGNDNADRVEVSNTAFFTSVANASNTIRWKARKEERENAVVSDFNL